MVLDKLQLKSALAEEKIGVGEKSKYFSQRLPGKKTEYHPQVFAEITDIVSSGVPAEVCGNIMSYDLESLSIKYGPALPDYHLHTLTEILLLAAKSAKYNVLYRGHGYLSLSSVPTKGNTATLHTPDYPTWTPHRNTEQAQRLSEDLSIAIGGSVRVTTGYDLVGVMVENAEHAWLGSVERSSVGSIENLISRHITLCAAKVARETFWNTTVAK